MFNNTAIWEDLDIPLSSITDADLAALEIRLAVAIEEGDLCFTPKKILAKACWIHNLELKYSEAKGLLVEIRNTLKAGYQDFYFYHKGLQIHFYGGQVR